MKAIVVFCPHRPASPIPDKPIFGHVAWGYEYPDGSWAIGSLEGPNWQGSYNGYWSVKKDSLNQALDYFARLKLTLNTDYDCYKLLNVSEGISVDIVKADEVVASRRHMNYSLINNNCMDFAYLVLKAYANCAYNDNQLPNPDLNWAPVKWFNKIKSDQYSNLPFLPNVDSITSCLEVEQCASFDQAVFKDPAVEGIQWQMEDFIPPSE
jgi:hypothetical protein